MAQQEQAGQRMTDIAQAERDKLFPRNTYAPDKDVYGPQHPNALTDGDEKGRGSSVFLGVHDQETGTKTDNLTRKDLIKTNNFNYKEQYISVSDDNTNSVGLTP